MKGIFKSNQLFVIPYFIFLILGGFVIFANSKLDVHLFINSLHAPFFDTLFYYLTFLGDGVVAVLVILMLLAVKYRFALIVGLSNIISSGVVQFLKHYVFEDHVRPKKFFEGIHDLYLVPGVENYLYNSFPSGHSTCAFALYFSLALLTPKSSYKFLFFLLAFLVGYSRIYLSQHFLEDVYAGSLIGTIIAFFVYYFIQKYKKPKIEKSIVSYFQ